MASRVLPRTVGIAATFAAALFTGSLAQAGDRDFFEKTAGIWKGPGEIVAGKYKGTKFNCTLSGDPNKDGKTGMTLDGSCRVGIFNQPMNASFVRSHSGYGGTFLDGAKGKGLDIISGNVRGNKVIVGIQRKDLNGAMVAHMQTRNDMNVTISVRVGEKLIPVIGMSLKRQMDKVAGK